MSRISQLAEVLRNNQIDAYFAQTPISMGYLHGFWESSHERFLTLAIFATGEVRLICPSLSAAQAARVGIADIRSWSDGEDPYELVRELATDWNLKTGIVAVDDEMPAAMLLGLENALPTALFRAGGTSISSVMRSKDADELDLLTRSGSIADRTYDALLKFLCPGLTERQIERFINDSMLDLGGKPTFCIVGTGSGGAEPHHLTGNSVVEAGDTIVLDFGCSLEGYQSDITRTVAVGHASEESQKVYDVVYRAHMAAREVIRPGVTSSEVDAAARAVIEAAGYGPQFFHRTGHGIGLHGHEEPYIAPGNPTVLEVGDCFSIEPGIYLEGKFGVRIENIVTVTETGHRSFNGEPSASITVVA